MILNQKLAQKLVDNIMKNLGYNINIMNESGIIIASGNKERIGTYHKIAKDVIDKKKRIDIKSDKVGSYKGVKEGINMPFYHNNQIAGVIGITGNPMEIENVAEMVRMATEVMLEQEFLRERIYSHQNQKSFFINKLININSESEALEVVQWGLKLGYDLNIPRVVCILSVQNLKEIEKSNPLYTREKIKDITLQCIKNSKYHSKQDISAFINVDDIVIFKTINPNKLLEYRQVITTYVNDIKNQISSQLDIQWMMCIGTYHEKLLGLRKSFEEAQQVHDMVVKLKKSDIYFAQDYAFDYLVSLIPKEDMDHFIKYSYNKIKDKDDIIKTINSLVENNFCLKTTAEKLYVHRNTIIFRMKKIKDILNIDPLQKEKDRIMLHLLYYYIKLYGK